MYTPLTSDCPEYQPIYTLAYQYDPDAELFLFGPGTRYPGKSIDVFIRCKVINPELRREIKERLVAQYQMNWVELV